MVQIANDMFSTISLLIKGLFNDEFINLNIITKSMFEIGAKRETTPAAK